MPAASPARDERENAGIAARFADTRALTEALVQPLGDADATIQSMDDASPAKWHLAHTTWFWETFLLRDHAPGYTLFDEKFPFLFNSYYEAEGDRIARGRRGLVTRPSLDEVLDYRRHVTAAIQPLLEDPRHAELVELGIAHEQQHIELLLTDIKHAFSKNPLGPAMWDDNVSPRAGGDLPQTERHAETDPGLRRGSPHAFEDGWYSHPGGIARIGHQADGFAFDNEGPAHRVLLEPFALSKQLVTNADWDAFIADGGYETASLWLSDAWAWIARCNIRAPLYWRDGEQFTHTGWQERDPNAPVTHISYYEADAFASWVGARLPTEFEWEAVARGQHADDAPAHDPAGGNQLDPVSSWAAPPMPRGSDGLFGDCWQFTRSGYLPYPRFKPAEGAVGEYNGKFMSGQWVLKGASCATVRGHSRASYRNFFYPQQRWQFTGLRLAKDA
ncbi:ergothioneine biosynthesis protein EgtB [Paraurantiacibacter namhicola]|uniref:Iron(II)-dependent oxidoreductase EgtB n=1 Tax=Paraurantiacibacter namhicola TaxID=645517 RepID=A0A1C7D7W9_9SPHN|nr:ergothioneine biosynthesis protein EgtB [Paraurantiacibacter namhicola]ANU07574.1 Iron(II)-dependent oxidoreductase EgtB [Paraurantiacibacter namhicola]